MLTVVYKIVNVPVFFLLSPIFSLPSPTCISLLSLSSVSLPLLYYFTSLPLSFCLAEGWEYIFWEICCFSCALTLGYEKVGVPLSLLFSLLPLPFISVPLPLPLSFSFPYSLSLLSALLAVSSISSLSFQSALFILSLSLPLPTDSSFSPISITPSCFYLL